MPVLPRAATPMRASCNGPVPSPKHTLRNGSAYRRVGPAWLSAAAGPPVRPLALLLAVAIARAGRPGSWRGSASGLPRVAGRKREAAWRGRGSGGRTDGNGTADAGPTQQPAQCGGPCTSVRGTRRPGAGGNARTRRDGRNLARRPGSGGARRMRLRARTAGRPGRATGSLRVRQRTAAGRSRGEAGTCTGPSGGRRARRAAGEGRPGAIAHSGRWRSQGRGDARSAGARRSR